jgi:hypothetical protein
MGGSEFTVSADALNLSFIALLYFSLALFCYWRLLPRLTTVARWLASGFVAAQLIVIFVSLATPPSASDDWWRWNLNREFNIASALASTQLALVAGVALLGAWVARTQAAWQGLYLIGIGLVFLFLAWDEYYLVHEQLLNWKRYYVAVGAVVAMATMATALRSPKRRRTWYACLFIGLAMSGTGATVFELFPTTCGDQGFFRLQGCLEFALWEEAAEFAGTWLALVSMCGLLTDAQAGPKRFIQTILCLLPALWILILVINSVIPGLELRLLAKPASVEFESGAHLRGFRLDISDGAARLALYTSEKRGKHAELTYSARLVDRATGETIASRNEKAESRVNFWMLRPGDSPIFRQGMEVGLPAQRPVDRAIWVVLSLWREQDDEFISQEVLASDHPLLNETEVILGEFLLGAASDSASSNPLATLEN